MCKRKRDETVTPRMKQCLKMQDAHLAETQQSLRPIRPELSTVNDKIGNSKEEKTSITMSIGKLDGGTTESHGETRRQRFHLQLRSSQLHNGIRVGTHGNLHHLRNRGDFGFLEGIAEKSTEGVDRTRTHNTHLCSTVLFTSPAGTPEKNLSSGVARVSPFVVLVPALYHEYIIFLIHSSFYHEARTRSTIGTTRSTPRTPSTSCTSPISHS